uniref:Lipoxygenase domain-containing protein n=1 Tax=Ficedula albicollis TaxID=59894 RepID=U3JDD0_FICAL
MAIYKVTVATDDMVEAGTNNSISITLVGSYSESHWTTVFFLFLPGKVGMGIGTQGVVELSLGHEGWHRVPQGCEGCMGCPGDDVRVTALSGTLYRFPCYQWLEGVTTVEVLEGKKLVKDKLHILREHRSQELAAWQEAYQWKNFAQGWPRCLNVDSIFELDSNIQFSRIRANNFTGFLIFQAASYFLSGFLLRHTSWNSLDEMRTIFSRTQVPEYVAKHWQDDFFDSQFLNGNNPIIIHRCTTLPLNFLVTPEMVARSLGGGTDLSKELQEGRIFIVDYKVLEDIPTNTIYGCQQHIVAPLCLLHQGIDGLLRPIAIQLSQTPGPCSPIFLPSDDEWVWLLAKTWVHNTDFYSHQLLTHLLRTRLFGEVFAIANLRHLPPPLQGKLLMPHFHFTLHIITLARTVLISRGVTYEGLLLVVQQGLEQVTYTSLCLPDDICHRGMSHVPNYHYRDDGMRLWEVVLACPRISQSPHTYGSFVTGIVTFYYSGDAAVTGDTELQAWVMDITNGFLGRTSSGVPSSLQTVAELIKFLTMVMFTRSSQHVAVNNGQYDLGAFIPNTPSSMRHPPPCEEGRAFLQHFLDTIPEVATTANILVALILLSSQFKDRRLLGQYPEEWFTEAEPCRLIRAFQGWLEEIRDRIEERNHLAELRYNYLNPLETENSISI